MAPTGPPFGGAGVLPEGIHFHQVDTEDKQSSALEPEAVICSVLGQEILQLNLQMLRTAAGH